MNRFEIMLQHSAGRIRIETAARDWKAAARLVLQHESAPVSSILAIADLGPIAAAQGPIPA
jgi:hypothetical protein